MNRLERHQAKKKSFHWMVPLFSILFCIFIIAGFIGFQHSKNSVSVNAPKEDLGKKVVIHLPNGHDVFTYENLIVKKNGKTYYKGDRNTIDLTGGKIEYKNWK